MREDLIELEQIYKELNALEKEGHTVEEGYTTIWKKQSLDAIFRFAEHAEKIFNQLKGMESKYARDSLKEHHIECAFRSVKDLKGRVNDAIQRPYYDTTNAQYIQSDINNIDSYILYFINHWSALRKGYEDGEFLRKKELLIKWDFNIFKEPELANMLIAEWTTVEQAVRMLYTRDRGYSPTYIWNVIFLFKDFILEGLSKEEIMAIRKNFETNQENPDFSSEFSGFLHEVGLAREKKRKESYEKLREVMIFGAMIISTSTVGSHLGQHIMGEMLPEFKKNLKSKEDFDNFFRLGCNLYEKDPYLTRVIVLELSRYFFNFYYNDKAKALKIMYRLGTTIPKEYMHNLLQPARVIAEIFPFLLKDERGMERYIELCARVSRYDSRDIDYLFKGVSSNHVNIGIDTLNWLIDTFEIGAVVAIITLFGLVNPDFHLLEELNKPNTKERIGRFRKLRIDGQVSDTMKNFSTFLQRARNNEEALSIIISILSFLEKEVDNNKQKIRKLVNIERIPKRIFDYYSDFLIYTLGSSPGNFMKIVDNVHCAVKIEANFSSEIVSLAKIARTFRLNLNQYNTYGIKPEEIEKLYLFLCAQLGKKPKIEKIRKAINKIGTQHQKTAFEEINLIILNLAIEYFSKGSFIKVEEKFFEFCGVKLPEEIDSDDAINALLISKRCVKGRNDEKSRMLIREVCLKNTYPFKKYPEAFPYCHPNNLRFENMMRSIGINMDPWLKGYEESFKPNIANSIESIEKIKQSHVTEAIEHYNELGIDVKPEEIFERFASIKDHLDQNLVQDIKVHLNAIEGLKSRIIGSYGLKKVKVYIELNPLKVLQMGNVVSGSCLNVDGGNSWTTITNAMDINKRVLYAVGPTGQIVGRRLISMTDDGSIIQFGTYNNYPDIDLDQVFERFTRKLADKCNAQVANGGKVELLLGDSWYAGTDIVNFGEKSKVQYSNVA